MQRYYKKTKTEKKTRLFSPLPPKIIIYKYTFCTKEIQCATQICHKSAFDCFFNEKYSYLNDFKTTCQYLQIILPEDSRHR